MDEFAPSSSNTASSSSNSNVFASNKKKSRIDSVALALANRMSSSLGAGPPPFASLAANAAVVGPSTAETAQQKASLCSVCGLSTTADEATSLKTCPVCKSQIHAECAAQSTVGTAFFSCVPCSKRLGSFAHLLLATNDGRRHLPAASLYDEDIGTSVATMPQSLSFSPMSSGGGQSVRHDSSSAGTLCATSSAVSLEEACGMATTDFAPGGGTSTRPSSRAVAGITGRTDHFLCCASSPLSSTATPTSRSSTPLFPQDGECSDNDEYHPPGTIIRRTESTRGGRGKGRKPTSASLHRQQSSSSTAMRTRSFGKPPSTASSSSYAAKFDDLVHFKAEEKPGGGGGSGKRSRGGNASKGKGGGRGRRPTGAGGGRGSKLVSMYATALAAAAATTTATSIMPTSSPMTRRASSAADEQRHHQKVEDGGGQTAADKEYIRTCIVTSREDKFMTEVSMCLVCGSVGKGTEGSMITCSCCAQSFHTYCVLMHDKLNPTAMKRGWRCLDCTVCEGCGSGEDEPNLLLCDECDISYHTYCLEPPLGCIPRGSWRCKWCATCSRCGAQIKIGSDLLRLEGFCEVCYSLRKCFKCQMPYDIGDLMLKCGRCLRWLHAKCEGLTTEEQAENAAENAFRCSFCRPQTLSDALFVPVVVDNVMISKQAVEQIQSIFGLRKFTTAAGGGGFAANFGDHFGNIARAMSYEQDDMDMGEELQEQIIASVFAGRGGRGCAGGGRGGGPGRRMLKIGVGGFNVRTPKNRLPLMMGSSNSNGGTSVNTEEEFQQQQSFLLDEDGSPLLGPNGKPRIRRPRKLKRPLLEDAYPAQIQESFFGVTPVDSRMLADQTVDEPVLSDYKKALPPPTVGVSKFASELSEHSAELLRTEQEMDMLGDIPLVDNIMDGLDIEGLDFSDLIVGEEDEDELMTAESSNTAADHTINDAYNVGSSSNLVTSHSVVSEIFSPSSCSSIRTPSRVLEPGPAPPMASAATTVVHNTPPIGGGQQRPTPAMSSDSGSGGGGKLMTEQKQSAAAIAAERWEEDEPLGDKATKAAVLYANVHHAYLKDKFPVWCDRVRQINRVWRELNADRRQEFVEWARKNRANCPTIRRRGRRTLSAEGNVQSQPATAAATTVSTEIAASTGPQPMLFKHSPNAMDQQLVVPKREMPDSDSVPQTSSITVLNPQQHRGQQQLFESSKPSSSTFPVSSVGNSTTASAAPFHHQSVGLNAQQDNGTTTTTKRTQQQQSVIELEQDVRLAEARLEQLKKDKRALAARQRVLLKKTHPMAPEEANRHAAELQHVQNNVDSAKKALQQHQRHVDRQRQRLREQQQQLMMVGETNNAITMAPAQQQQRVAQPTTTLAADLNNANTATTVRTDTTMGGDQQQQYQCQRQQQMQHYQILGQQQAVGDHQQLKPQQQQQYGDGADGKCLPLQKQQHQQQQDMLVQQQQKLQQTMMAGRGPTQDTMASSTSATQQQQPRQEPPSGLLFLPKQQQQQRSRMAPLQQTEHGEQSATTSSEQKPAILVDQQQQKHVVKGTRGRKRKKALLDNVRSSVLGGVPFASLQTSLDKDVFDTMDTLIGFVITSMDNDGAIADNALLVQKILSQQNNAAGNNNGNAASSAASGGDQLGAAKIKKRRQTQPKARSQPDTSNNELDLIQERIKKAIEMIPPITNYMEQYQANDKQMMEYPDQSALPDHEGSEPPLVGNALGAYSLPFMPDYYDELVTVREYVDEESLLPPGMDEICWNCDLDAMAAAARDDIDKDTGVDPSLITNGEPPTKLDTAAECCPFSEDDGDDEPLLHFLSIDSIGNRSKIVKSMTLLGSQGSSQEAPLEPHWSRFDEEPKDLDRPVDVVLTVDPSVMDRDEFVESLCQILGITDIDRITELDTPPYTPGSPKHANGYHTTTEDIDNNYAHQQKKNVDGSLTEGGTTVAEMSITKLNASREKSICKNCNTFIPSDKTPIDDTHGRLGLLSESKGEKLTFCSMHCYYKFLALYRIPLNVESLEMAERYVDNMTLETLRQISADTFAKRINAGGLPPHAMFLSNEQYAVTAAVLTAAGGNCATTALAAVDGIAVAQREFMIKTSELPALLLHQQNMDKKRAIAQSAGYKWRGSGWNICDPALIQSFKRQNDGTKQQFAAIQLQANEKRVDWSEDSRQCSFCEQIGDGDQRLTGRLLNVDANKWVHVNCALWSAEVHVSEDGGLINVEAALSRAKLTECRLCGRQGASVRCYKLDCANNELAAFHLICARQSHGHFIKDKTFFCAEHDIRSDAVVYDLSALRRLFVQRDENQLLSKIFNHSYQTEMVMRVGSLIFHRIGQLLPDQLKAFTTEEHIFPVGYRVTRLFWSSRDINDRVRYECTVLDDGDGKPEFCVKMVDDGGKEERRGSSPTAAWTQILHSIADFRANSTSDVLRFFPKQMSGEYLYGFLEPSISKMLESLPGIDQLYTYTFKHGGIPLMDLPLAENPSGCARCEPCFRTLVKQRHRPIISNSPKKSVVVRSAAAIFDSDAVVPREGRTTRNNFARFVLPSKMDQEMLRAYKASGISERMLQAPYLRSIDNMAQLVAQYREMKRECRSNVYLARSKIQGMGLYAKRDLDMNQMIIEYIGEIIRSEVCELRQCRYIEQNRGEYMFRIDCDWVVDATMAGGLARYINHSCDPNCGTKILPVNDDKKVVIFANRPIKAGEELTYDYQFDIEETGKKISCLCGAPNCVKWMN